MQSFFKITVLGLSLGGLCACTPNEKRGAGKDSGSQPHIDQSVPAKKYISPTEMDRLKSILSEKNQPGIGQFLLNDPDDSQEAKAKKTWELKHISSEQKSMIDEIQNKCHIEQPVNKQSITHPNVVGMQFIRTKQSSVSGAACPVEFRSTSRGVSTVLSIDQGTKKSTYATRYVIESHLKYKSTEWQNRTQLLESSLGIRIDFASKSNLDSSQTFGSGQGPVYGSLVFKNGKIPIDGKLWMVETGTGQETRTEINFLMSGRKYQFLIIVIGQAKRMYIDGNEVNPQDFPWLKGSED